MNCIFTESDCKVFVRRFRSLLQSTVIVGDPACWAAIDRVFSLPTAYGLRLTKSLPIQYDYVLDRIWKAHEAYSFRDGTAVPATESSNQWYFHLMVEEAFEALKPSDLILIFGYGVYEAISKEAKEKTCTECGSAV